MIANKLNTGKMRHRIEIVKPSGAQDASGGVTEDISAWESVLQCWAQVEALSAKDAAAAGSFVSQSSHQITIRFPRSVIPITNNMRIWFKTRTFQIVAPINPDEENNKLVLLATEINSSVEQNPTPSVS